MDRKISVVQIKQGAVGLIWTSPVSNPTCTARHTHIGRVVLLIVLTLLHYEWGWSGRHLSATTTLAQAMYTCTLCKSEDDAGFKKSIRLAGVITWEVLFCMCSIPLVLSPPHVWNKNHVRFPAATRLKSNPRRISCRYASEIKPTSNFPPLHVWNHTHVEFPAEVPELLVRNGLDGGSVNGAAAVTSGQRKRVFCDHRLSGWCVGSYKHLRKLRSTGMMWRCYWSFWTGRRGDGTLERGGKWIIFRELPQSHERVCSQSHMGGMNSKMM